MAMNKLVEFAQGEQIRRLKEDEIMSDYLWCGAGHSPKTVANGECDFHDSAQYGCSECPEFKPISQIETKLRTK